MLRIDGHRHRIYKPRQVAGAADRFQMAFFDKNGPEPIANGNAPQNAGIFDLAANLADLQDGVITAAELGPGPAVDLLAHMNLHRLENDR